MPSEGLGGAMQDRFIWGHPTERADIDNYKAIVLGRLESKKAGRFEAVEAIDRALDRLSSKSASLLQADSVIAAVLVITPPWAPSNTLTVCGYINFAGFFCVLASCCLLLINFLVVWAKDQDTYRHPDKDFEFAYGIYRARSIRLTISLFLTIFALFCCGISYLIIPLFLS